MWFAYSKLIEKRNAIRYRLPVVHITELTAFSIKGLGNPDSI